MSLLLQDSLLFAKSAKVDLIRRSGRKKRGAGGEGRGGGGNPEVGRERSQQHRKGINHKSVLGKSERPSTYVSFPG